MIWSQVTAGFGWSATDNDGKARVFLDRRVCRRPGFDHGFGGRAGIAATLDLYAEPGLFGDALSFEALFADDIRDACIASPEKNIDRDGSTEQEGEGEDHDHGESPSDRPEDPFVGTTTIVGIGHSRESNTRLQVVSTKARRGQVAQ